MINIRKISLIIMIVISSFVLSGCASKANFNHTPVHESEFKKNIGVLEAEYSDIEKYDRIFASPTDVPKLEELEKKWGKAETEMQWTHSFINIGMMAGFAVSGLVSVPIAVGIGLFTAIPHEKYTWQKGDYKIVAYGRSELFYGFEKRVARWEWEKNTVKLDEKITLNKVINE